MKVIIDISPLRSGHKTRGIGAYTRNLVKALKTLDKKNSYILTSKHQQTKADLIHYPYFDFFFPTLPFNRKIPSIITIHDVIPLIFPQRYPSGIRGKINFIRQKTALKFVKAIITDSQNSKKDIIKYLHQPKQNIHVIYLAAGKKFKKAPLTNITSAIKKYHLPSKYILYVGDINYNKNLPRFIRAFAKVKTPAHLVFVSRALKDKHLPETKLINETVMENDLTDRFHALTNVPLDPPTNLIAIYSAATAYVQPSLYEGFGLPVLEALSCQTPVLSSNISSLPEVGGNAVIYVDPKREDSITHGLNKILNLSTKDREKVIMAGLSQAQKFSWAKTAIDTIRIYRKVLNQ